MTTFSLAFSLFLLMDPVGNIPLYLSFLKGIPPQKQRKIILRELLIALFIIFLFNFIGEALLNFLKISENTVQIAGGIILFLLSLKMVFPSPKQVSMAKLEEPFIVPLAVPLIAGPSVLAAVMLYTSQYPNIIMLSAILLAWLLSLLILILSPLLSRYLGIKGITACERLMGLIIVLISVQMFLNGLSGFMQAI